MKIILHGKLRRMFGPEFEIETYRVSDALEGLSRQLEGWPTDMVVDVVDFDTEEKIFAITDVEEIHVVPRLSGSGGFARIAIGAVLIAAAFIVPGVNIVAGLTLGGLLFSAGTALVLSGVMSFFMKAPSISKENDPPASKYIGGGGNTTEIGTYRTLAWGIVRVPGHWLSMQVDAKGLVKARFPASPPA